MHHNPSYHSNATALVQHRPHVTTTTTTVAAGTTTAEAGGHASSTPSVLMNRHPSPTQGGHDPDQDQSMDSVMPSVVTSGSTTATRPTVQVNAHASTFTHAHVTMVNQGNAAKKARVIPTPQVHSSTTRSPMVQHNQAATAISTYSSSSSSSSQAMVNRSGAGDHQTLNEIYVTTPGVLFVLLSADFRVMLLHVPEGLRDSNFDRKLKAGTSHA